MATRFLVAEVDVDRDGAVSLPRVETLRSVSDHCAQALEAGVPLDAEVKFGYVPERLAIGLYVEKPEDLTRMRFQDLRTRANSGPPEYREAAWAEIQRRVEAFGLAGED